MNHTQQGISPTGWISTGQSSSQFAEVNAICSEVNILCLLKYERSTTPSLTPQLVSISVYPHPLAKWGDLQQQFFSLDSVTQKGTHPLDLLLFLVWHRLEKKNQNKTKNFFSRKKKILKVGVIPKGLARPHTPIVLLVWQRLRQLFA